jgi:hypothetical protein
VRDLVGMNEKQGFIFHLEPQAHHRGRQVPYLGPEVEREPEVASAYKSCWVVMCLTVAHPAAATP